MAKAKHEWREELPWWRFYSRLFKEVLAHSWGWTDSVASVLGIVVPLAIHLHPKAESKMTALAWEIPIGVFAALGAFRLLAAPYLLYRDQHIHIATKEAEFSQTIDGLEQPDVGLVWDFTEDQKKFRSFAGATEKNIFIENRSDRHIYNVHVDRVKLTQELSFDPINEVAPHSRYLALGRWNGRSSRETNYIYFFANNEDELIKKGWFLKKAHNEGISDSFVKLPMAVTYECGNTKWKWEFEFIYDAGGDSWFEKKAGFRV